MNDWSCVPFNGTECNAGADTFDGNAKDSSLTFEIDPHKRSSTKHDIVTKLFSIGGLTLLIFNINNFFFYLAISNVDCSIGSGSKIRIVSDHDYGS